MRLPDAIGSLLETNTLPDLGPGPRPGVKSEAQLREPLDAAISTLKLPSDRKDLIRALLLLWHDHLEAAHLLAQSIDNPDGAFVHGIMHRREPDYGNAAYWLRHVGEHQTFLEIARRVGSEVNDAGLKARLIAKGNWNPFGFIDACQSVAGKSDAQRESDFLRQAQKHETEALLLYFFASS